MDRPLAVRVQLFAAAASRGTAGEVLLGMAMPLLSADALEEWMVDVIMEAFAGDDARALAVFEKAKARLPRIGFRASSVVLPALVRDKRAVADVFRLTFGIDGLLLLAEAPEDVARVPWRLLVSSVPGPHPKECFQVLEILMRRGLRKATWGAFTAFARNRVRLSMNSVELAFQALGSAERTEDLRFLVEVAREVGPPSAPLLEAYARALRVDGDVAEAQRMEAELQHQRPGVKPVGSFHSNARHSVFASPLVPRARKRASSLTISAWQRKSDEWGRMEEVAMSCAMVAMGPDLPP